MTGIDQTVLLPTPALSVAWDMLDLGNVHPMLGARRLWVAESAQRQLHAATIEYLTALGLARDETPTPQFRALLQVIAYAEREFFARSEPSHGPSRSVLIAQRAEDAVQVIATDDRVEIRATAPTRLATTLFDLLPPLPGAPVRAVSVPGASDAAPDPFDEDNNTHEYFNSVLSQPRIAVHQLYVARRSNGTHTTGGPIYALDLESGRVLTYQNTNDRKELIPGDPRAIVKVLNDAIGAL
ncbi:ESX secretion-associated protein EspG [Amycolatopsis benzoatilytica]|uniref:ESX secretion-associated protein EspG n=1 Tax=Amycolatopsis benzoatilytica TaxID=346045 RepID=UPI000380AB38|nr:ESX secretion-associated protein EspG [Amycolatopsis benzoatilytica]